MRMTNLYIGRYQFEHAITYKEFLVTENRTLF